MTQELMTTPLYPLHRELGAKMVSFAGYEMPVSYPAGVINEHLHTRHAVSLFDVSHMGQIRVRGAQAAAELERLLPVDLDQLAPHRQCYTFLTNNDGGVRDDLMLCRQAQDDFLLVVNAACKQDDLAYLNSNLSANIEISLLAQQALLALQGPQSASVMASLAPALVNLPFMQGRACEIDGIACYVTRSGYTGEDGYEISLAAVQAEALARRLLSFEAVQPAGLGARDSLRLEAGLCLYGHELDNHTSPVEAGLGWAIAPTRRTGGSKSGGFPGDAGILQQMTGTVSRKRVGLRAQTRAPVRAGTGLENTAGEAVGEVTSGGYSPVLETAIAMAYLDADYSAPDTQLRANVRGTLRELVVVELPFVAHRYYKK